MWRKTLAGRGRNSPLGQLEVFFHSLLIFCFAGPSIISLELGSDMEVERGGKGTSMLLSLEKQSGNIRQRNLWSFRNFLKVPNIVISSGFVQYLNKIEL